MKPGRGKGFSFSSLLLLSLSLEAFAKPSRRRRNPRRGVCYESRRRQQIKQSYQLHVVDLDEVIRREEETKRKNKEIKTETKEEKKAEKMLPEKKNSTYVVLPCIDKLRDELSCAICLEIFEPSTTTCGHSFCKKCFAVCSRQVWKEMPQMQTAENMGGGGGVDKE